MAGTQRGIIGATAVCALAATASAAPVSYACALARGGSDLQLAFDLDMAAFAPPLDPNDPPHRQVSRVTMADTTFEAEAVLTDGATRGFWAPEQGLMLTMARDGGARLTDGAETDWRGQCEEM